MGKIYTDKLTKGRRTYFFDINKSEQGDFYLKISESKKTENGFDHSSLLVFKECAKDFAIIFLKVMIKFNELLESEQESEKKYSVEEIRKTYKHSYLPWTAEDDTKLELLFFEGKKIKELTQIFGRNYGAISSRIKKLQLTKKNKT